MKFEIMATDGIAVRALLGAAEKLHELTEERNIILGMFEPDALGADQDCPVAAVMAKRESGGMPSLAVTIERVPRIIRIAPDEAEPEPVEHDTDGAAHLYKLSDGTKSCCCIGPCCDTGDDQCVCPECEDTSHNHSQRP